MQDDVDELRIADLRGTLGHRLQHRLHVGGRGGDHLQDLAGGGLALQRLLRLVEQQRVLDRDRRLVCKGLQQRNQLRRKRARLLAADADDADGLAPLQDRHRQAAAVITRFRHAAERIVGILLHVVDLHRSLGKEASAIERVGAWQHRKRGAHPGFGLGGHAAIADQLQPFAVEARGEAQARATEHAGPLGYGVEHRRHVGGGFADDAQDVCSRGLALQRLLRLVEQAHVLHRDGGLVGERGDEFDLLVVEKPRLLAAERQHADGHAFAQDRHGQQRAVAAHLLHVDAAVNAAVGGVFHLVRRLQRHRLRRDRVLVEQRDRVRLQVLDQRRRGAVQAGGVAQVALDAEDHAHPGLAQPRGGADQGVQHGSQVEGGAADRLEHIGGGGLARQRLLRLVEQPRVLDRDHRLVGEGLEQRMFLGRKRPDRESHHGQHADASALPHQRHGQRGVVPPHPLRGQLCPDGGVGVIERVTQLERAAGPEQLAGRRVIHRARIGRTPGGLQGGHHVASKFGPCGGRGMHALHIQQPGLIDEEEVEERRREQLLAALQDLVEYRRGIGHGVADHVQHFRRGRLAFQRFLRLVEQPHVLDCDHRLVGKGRQQGHLPIRERPFGFGHRDRADGAAMLQHGHDQQRPVAGGDGQFARRGGHVRGTLHVLQVNDPAFRNGARRHVVGIHRHREQPLRHGQCVAHPVVVRDQVNESVLHQQARAVHAVAKAHGALHDGIEDRLRVRG